MKISANCKKAFIIAVFVLLCISTVLFSLKNDSVGTIISILGSIASLYAIIEAFLKVKNIEQQNKEIKIAIDDKIITINKQENIEQIHKYIEVIARIQQYITMRNSEAALLLIEGLQMFLHGLQSNPTTTEELKTKIATHLRNINKDAAQLRNRGENEQFPKDVDCKVLINDFEKLHDLLVKYSQQMHYENGKQQL